MRAASRNKYFVIEPLHTNMWESTVLECELWGNTDITFTAVSYLFINIAKIQERDGDKRHRALEEI